MYSKTIFPCGVFSCIPSVVGVSVYDARPSQACTVQTSVPKMNIERPALETAALNIRTYGVTSISESCRVFYFAADPASVGFYHLRTMRNTRHSMDCQMRSKQGRAIWLDAFGTDLYRRAQYAPNDIVVNLILLEGSSVMNCDQTMPRNGQNESSSLRIGREPRRTAALHTCDLCRRLGEFSSLMVAIYGR